MTKPTVTQVSANFQPSAPGRPDLTPRQLEILDLLDDGLTLVQIGKKFWVEEKTMRQHAYRLRLALGAKTNAQAVGIGHRLGLLPVVKP